MTKENTRYNYSPKPMGDYILQGLESKCEVGQIQKLIKNQEVWNFFWLSLPLLDKVPGSGARWFHHYQAVTGAAVAVTTDVMLDDVLFRKLSMHPLRFATWFEREDQSIYDAYNVFGGKPWVETVLKRAHCAAYRINNESNVTASDNVLRFPGSKSA